MTTIKKGSATLFHATGKPYSTISNKAVDAITNPDALAIWTFLQTKDNNWTVIGTWLQKRFGIGRDRYSRAMSHLEALGLIKYETNRCKETGKLAGRRIIVNFEPVITEMPENPQVGESTVRSTDKSENLQQPIKDFIPIKESTNNSLSSKPDNAPGDEKPDSTVQVCKRVIDHLNLKTGSAFRHADSHMRLIASRLKAGATEDELCRVIDRKCQEWLQNPDMRQYLRPATLFSPKNYDNYVGQLSQPLPDKGKGAAKHSGFSQVDYNAGVDENGYF
ncbi:hypothetical protein PAEH1_01390 [Paenalcaligenes hominis]|uniref:Phage conserved hypothetical protein C-terminal domain-containing protein n=1 Tax=Paenalcaligenes hominis TaxID=643674 RepID=A0A1U9JXP5_9BURK|nr:conserved phage C-terminal domain-containing protein [Paenalcaligenes hominis]AQS50534.1 hypothetical protein PAEH1_01390 [Paenalcaligenes hominis]